MRKGIRLTNQQFDELDHWRNTTPSADVFRNCSIILLSNGGHSIPGIAAILGCSPETVKRVRRLYRQRGLAALVPIKPPGRPSQATASFRELLAQAVQTNPQTLGYGFATWCATMDDSTTPRRCSSGWRPTETASKFSGCRPTVPV